MALCHYNGHEINQKVIQKRKMNQQISTAYGVLSHQKEHMLSMITQTFDLHKIFSVTFTQLSCAEARAFGFKGATSVSSKCGGCIFSVDIYIYICFLLFFSCILFNWIQLTYMDRPGKIQIPQNHPQIATIRRTLQKITSSAGFYQNIEY